MWRSFFLWVCYGSSPVRSLEGDSLPTMIRKVRQQKLDGQPDQVPVVKFAHADSARLRAKECVSKLRLVYRRRA
jgi:hypothetical protein